MSATSRSSRRTSNIATNAEWGINPAREVFASSHRARSSISLTAEEASYSIGRGVLAKRRSVLGLGETDQVEGSGVALSPSVAKLLSGSEFAEQRSTTRQTLIQQGSQLSPNASARTVGVRDGGGGRESLLLDLSLQAKLLHSTNQGNCLNFLKQWDYATTIPPVGAEAAFTALRQWDMQASSEEFGFAKAAVLHWERASTSLGILEAEMVITQACAATALEEVQFSSEEVVGMRIIHEFILDILGRDTAHGKIFERKVHSEFKKTHAVYGTTKVVAVTLIVCVNIFCFIYAILKGYSRGWAWQMQYVLACTLQLLVEILLFETMDVAWSHLVIPQFAAKEVNAARVRIQAIVNKFAEDAQIQGPRHVDPFNSADYFFVSKELARARPTSIESKLILRFESLAPTPGLSKRFDHGLGESEAEQVDETAKLSWGVRAMRRVRTTAIVVAVSFVNITASMPTAAQELALGIVQPILLGGGGYFISLCIHQPLFYLGFGVMAGLAYAAYLSLAHVSEHQEKLLGWMENLSFPQTSQAVGVDEADDLERAASVDEADDLERAASVDEVDDLERAAGVDEVNDLERVGLELIPESSSGGSDGDDYGDVSSIDYSPCISDCEELMFGRAISSCSSSSDGQIQISPFGSLPSYSDGKCSGSDEDEDEDEDEDIRGFNREGVVGAVEYIAEVVAERAEDVVSKHVSECVRKEMVRRQFEKVRISRLRYKESKRLQNEWIAYQKFIAEDAEIRRKAKDAKMRESWVSTTWAAAEMNVVAEPKPAPAPAPTGMGPGKE